MLRSMFAAVTGLRSHQAFMDVVGNNIANVNTTGYKTSSVLFEDLLSQQLNGAGAPTNSTGGTNPAQVGLGVRLTGISINFAQGATQLTGRSTDFAIQGDGFFVVDQGGQTAYTRNGSFSLDGNGNLVTADGAFVKGWQADQNGNVSTNASRRSPEDPGRSDHQPDHDHHDEDRRQPARRRGHRHRRERRDQRVQQPRHLDSVARRVHEDRQRGRRRQLAGEGVRLGEQPRVRARGRDVRPHGCAHQRQRRRSPRRS